MIKERTVIKKLSVLGLVLSVMLVLLWGCTAGAVTLEWDANTDDTVGYNVHYGNTSGGYTSFQYVSGIDTTTHTITLPDGDWYFVLTAIDEANNESGYSNEVTTNIDTVPPMVPGMLRIVTIITQ